MNALITAKVPYKWLVNQKESKILKTAPEVNEVWKAGGPVWINFANTIALASKGMDDVTRSADSLRWWLGIMGLSASIILGPEDLAFAAALRQTLSRVIQSVEHGMPIGADDLEQLNSVLANQHNWSQLDQLDNLTVVRRDLRSADTIQQAFGPVVQSLSESLVHGDMRRLRTCAHQDCELRFYDDSKNGARRWCTMSGCGNRAKAAAYLQRKKIQD